MLINNGLLAIQRFATMVSAIIAPTMTNTLKSVTARIRKLSLGRLQLHKLKVSKLPRWLKTAVTAVATVILIGLIAPYLIDVDRYRTLVASIIEDQTGRRVTIGKVRARVLPRVGFSVEGFRLSNPPGFAAGEVVSADAVRGTLAWGPLLRRKIRLSSIELVRPKLVLLENDRGQTNYSSQFGKQQGWPSLPSGGGKSGGPEQRSFQLSEVESISLTDAELTIARVGSRGGALVEPAHLRNINIRLGRMALDPLQPKLWEGDARLSGVALELPGWRGPIEFHSGRLTLRDGRIESEFRAGMGKAAEWKGSAHITDIEHAAVTFELSTAQLDVDQLLSMQAATPSANAGAARAKPAKGELVARGRINAERLRWSAYTANNATAEMRIFTDRAELWPVTVDVYGGTLQISARADLTQIPERFSSNVQIRNVDVGKMVAASPGSRGKLSGLGEADLQLFGSLGSAWRKSLSGTGHFGVREGRLPGGNLPGLGKSLAEIPFNLIQGDLSVHEGRIWSRQIHMDSPRGTADLHGSCSLDGVLDYTGQVALSPTGLTSGDGGQSPADAIAGILGGVLKQQNVGSITMSISIRGTLTDPKVQPGNFSMGRSAPIVPGQPASGAPKKNPLQDIFRRP